MSSSHLRKEHALNYDDVRMMLDQKSFWAEYEPIIDMKEGGIFGYEALARFSLNGVCVPPSPVLEVAHHAKELFFRLERELKETQLQHRPNEGILFVNIDPHNFSDTEKINYWRDLFEEIENICVEVTENTDDMQTALLSHCLDELQKSGIVIAQDDIGNDKKPFCFDLTHRAHFLKFDRTWLLKMRLCEDYKEILKGFLSFAKAQHKRTILEGVESEEDFALARSLGVDFVQGYIFKHLNIHSPRLMHGEGKR